MFRRWGLQRRIMAYVAAGMLLVTATFYYVGQRRVGEAADLVADERVAIAESLAGSLAEEVDHAFVDAREEFGRARVVGELAALRDAARELYGHYAEADALRFLKIESVALLDGAGDVVWRWPSGEYGAAAEPFAVDDWEGVEARIEWRTGGDSGQLFWVVVPLGGGGPLPSWAVVVVRGRATRDPLRTLVRGKASEETVPAALQYHVEVMDGEGMVVAAFGPDETVGVRSPHYPIARDVILQRQPSAMLHEAQEVNGGRKHIMAVVPVPGTPLSLVTEQDVDVALALPSRFRRDVFVFAIVGFLMTLGVAWITTSRVVGPTRQLTEATARMAAGELDEPISVSAQDEVGVLAENLEVMRRQLRAALRSVEEANQHLEQRVRERTLQLDSLVHRVMTAQEEERRRVSLELHDETAQALAALVMTLESMERDVAEPELATQLKEVRELASATLDGVRRTIMALRPAALKQRGVLAALRAYSEELFGHDGVRIDVRGEGTRAKLPGDTEIALFRIGQEALNNVARHANASNVHLFLRVEDDVAELVVEDDGRGFTPETAGGVPGAARRVGLTSMRERARLVGGEAFIESRPDAGTVVRVVVPTRR